MKDKGQRLKKKREGEKMEHIRNRALIQALKYDLARQYERIERAEQTIERAELEIIKLKQDLLKLGDELPLESGRQ